MPKHITRNTGIRSTIGIRKLLKLYHKNNTQKPKVSLSSQQSQGNQGKLLPLDTQAENSGSNKINSNNF